MIPSNLGQIVGRLMYANDGEAAAVIAPAGRPDRKAQVLTIVRVKGEIACRDVVAALRVTGAHASVLLHTMHGAGMLKRTGTPKHFLYSLPDAA